MRYFILILILGATIFSSCGKSKSCIDFENIDRNRVCGTIYDPVCGCDDVTYQNECRAEANGVVLWSKGPCIR